LAKYYGPNALRPAHSDQVCAVERLEGLVGDVEFTRAGLSVSVTEGDPAVVKAVGEVDIATVGALRDGLDEAAGEPVENDVDADLEQVDFIDVSGARTLVNADEKIVRGGHRFGISSASRVVRRLFSLLKLDHLFRHLR
jgi:anti-anti-sigma factor